MIDVVHEINAISRSVGTRTLEAGEAREWLSAFDRFWVPKLAALDTELARGRRQRRRTTASDDPHDPGAGDRPAGLNTPKEH